MAGTFSADFLVRTSDIRLAACPAHYTDRFTGATITLDNGEDGIRIRFQSATDDANRAAHEATAYIGKLARFWTLHFGEHLSAALVPQRTSTRFETPAPDGSVAGATVQLLGVEAIAIVESVRAVLTTHLSEPDVTHSFHEFGLREMAPAPAFAADLYNAKDMYFAAMQVDHQLTRFLILYSAVMLVGIFQGRKGQQETVDRLLLQEDPSIRQLSPPAGSGKSKNETEYTAARNRFIHPEGRDKDPSGAAAEIARLTPGLQRLTVRILKKG